MLDKEIIRKNKEHEIMRDYMSRMLRLANPHGRDVQRKLIAKKSYSRTEKILIIHKDVAEGLIANKQILKCTADELNKAALFLITKDTMEYLIKRFPKIINVYRQHHLKGINIIMGDIKAIVLPNDMLLNLSKQKEDVALGIGTVLASEYQGKIHSSSEIKQIITKNQDLIEGIAATAAYNNYNIKFITEDIRILLFNTFREKIVPKIKDLIQSDMVDISVVLNTIGKGEDNAKSIPISLDYDKRIDRTQYYQELRRQYKKLMEDKDRILANAIKLDKLTGITPKAGDNTGIVMNPADVYQRERLRGR